MQAPSLVESNIYILAVCNLLKASKLLNWFLCLYDINFGWLHPFFNYSDPPSYPLDSSKIVLIRCDLFHTNSNSNCFIFHCNIWFNLSTYLILCYFLLNSCCRLNCLYIFNRDTKSHFNLHFCLVRLCIAFHYRYKFFHSDSFIDIELINKVLLRAPGLILILLQTLVLLRIDYRIMYY